jgi:hypothetical protein
MPPSAIEWAGLVAGQTRRYRLTHKSVDSALGIGRRQLLDFCRLRPDAVRAEALTRERR